MLMRVFKRFVSYLIFFGVLATTSCVSAEKENIAEADYGLAIDSSRQVLQKIQLESNVPGLAVAVMIGGELVWKEGLGYADLENRIMADPDTTLFRIGSISKPLTATGLALLFEKGAIDINQPVQQYVKYFPVKEFTATVKQIAGHIGGIRHYKNGESFNKKRVKSVREALEWFKDDPLQYEPGTKYQYSSYGFNLLSAVVEEVSGERFTDYVDLHILYPLGMFHTFPENAGRTTNHVSRFYTFGENRKVTECYFVDNSFRWGSGGYLSTATDVARFGSAWLEEGFLKKETISLFTEPQFTSDSVSTNYGLGWVRKKTELGEWFGHNGTPIGGKARLVIYPEHKLVLAILTNLSATEFNDQEHRIAGYFIRANEKE